MSLFAQLHARPETAKTLCRSPRQDTATRSYAEPQDESPQEIDLPELIQQFQSTRQSIQEAERVAHLQLPLYCCCLSH